MKTTIPALILSACLFGFASAAPDSQGKGERPAVRHVEAVKKAHKKANPAKKADPVKKADSVKKAVPSAEMRKAQQAKRADAAKKSRPENAAERMVAKVKDLAARKERAEVNRRKAVENLKAAEVRLAAIVAEQKKIDAWKQAQQDAARKKAESDRRSAAAQASAREKEMIGRMKSDLSDLQRTVARQSQQLADLRAKIEAPAKKVTP